MNWHLLLKRGLALLGLLIWMAVLFSVGSTYLGPHLKSSLSPAEQNFAGVALLLVCTVDTLLFAALILAARIYGWRLMLWAGMAALCFWTLKARPWLAVLLLALIFSLIENDQHLFPNPLMPVIVRQTHFVETASSNFLLGLIAGALLLWRPATRPNQHVLTYQAPPV